MSNNPT